MTEHYVYNRHHKFVKVEAVFHPLPAGHRPVNRLGCSFLFLSIWTLLLKTQTLSGGQAGETGNPIALKTSGIVMMPLQSVVQPTIHKKGSYQILLRRFGCSTGDLKSIFLSGALDAKLTKNEIVAWKNAKFGILCGLLSLQELY